MYEVAMLAKSVILIGMPGSGKSTVGKLLADRLDVGFSDTDDLIVKSTGERLQDTLDRYGREGFLEKENEVLLSIEPETPQIISTGGSVVLHAEAMEHLKSIGTIVFLDADLPTIRKRLWNMNSRGIVFNDENDDIAGVYREREPLYYRYADIRVHIGKKRANELVREIMRSLK